MPRRGSSTAVNRRRFVQTTGVGGVAFLTGCLGDDEIDPDDDVTDDVDDTDDADVDDTDDDDTDADDTDDVDDAVPDIVETHDATVKWTIGGDLPADLQHSPYSDSPSLPHNAFGTENWNLLGSSVYDMEYYGQLVSDWEYQPGLLEFSFHDDFYWWSGDQVTVDDFIAEREFLDFNWGGEELDSWSEVVTYEKVDDNRVRLALADAWHERWALSETIDNYQLNANIHFHQPYIEQFEDAPDLDAIADIREDISGEFLRDDETLVNVWNTDWEYRYDGSIGEVGEDYFEFELVQTKNGNVKHFQNPENHDVLPNVERFRLLIREEAGEVRMDGFMEETHAFAYGESNPEAVEMHRDGQFDFATDLMIFPRPPNDQGGMQFNHEAHPGDDPNFRRAMAYLVDNSAWEGHPDAVPARRLHTFLSEEELEAFVSEDVIESFTDYGWDEMRFDDAEAELVAGGFEQDADGHWLMREDGAEGDAGEPMDFTVDVRGFMMYVLDQATDFWADLEGFGIQNEVLGGDFGEEDWTFTYSYTGGGSPDHAFNHVFNDMAPGWSRREQNIPSTVLAPEFGDTNESGADIDTWVEYEVGPMADRLPVTTEAEQYQTLVDQLAWVINQACNHFSTAPAQRHHVLNDNTWHWPPLEATPERYHNLLMDLGHRVIQYVPEDER